MKKNIGYYTLYVNPVCDYYGNYEKWEKEFRFQFLNHTLPSTRKKKLDSLHFFIAMPDHWPTEKWQECVGKPHLSTPDLGELVRNVLSAAEINLRDISAKKKWCQVNAIVLGYDFNREEK